MDDSLLEIESWSEKMEMIFTGAWSLASALSELSQIDSEFS